MQGFQFQMSRSAVVFFFLMVSGALLFFPSQAQAQNLRALQDKIKALEEKLKGYEDLKKELESLKDMIKGVQKEQETQKAKMAEVEPLKKALEGLSKLSISGGATGILQGTGGVNKNEGGDDGFASGSFDLIFEYSPMKDWKVVLDLEAIGGNGPDNFATLHGLNDDAGTTNDNVTILEAYLEGTLFGGRATLTVGKIDITNYIEGNAYAGDETTQFLSSGFVNNNVFTAPSNGPGVRARLDVISDFLYVEAGAMAQDSDGNSRSTDKLFEDVYAAAEVGVTPKFFGRPGTYRLWATFDGAGRKRRMNGALRDDTAMGIGVSFDQELADWFGVFFRIGTRESDNINYNTKAAWSVGGQFPHLIPYRPDDVFGFAYGEISPTTRDFGKNARDEKMIEAYYNWFFTENFQISGIIQHVIDGNANPNLDDVTVFGLRAQTNF